MTVVLPLQCSAEKNHCTSSSFAFTPTLSIPRLGEIGLARHVPGNIVGIATCVCCGSRYMVKEECDGVRSLVPLG